MSIVYTLLYTMELVIPLVALSGLYFISKENNANDDDDDNLEEGFMGNNVMEDRLSNTNIPNVNYPRELTANDLSLSDAAVDITTKLSNDNKYSGGAYTDKYYNISDPKDLLNNEKWASKTGMKYATQEASLNSNDYTSLTGEVVGNDYFRHNNMVPFGKKIHSRKFEPNQNEGLMDNYLGSGSQTIDKKEQSPLFAPNENYQWAHGLPNQNDFMQSRVNPSLKMANVVPFKQEKVAPGLGLGYTTEGVGGYNSGMLERESWMPKTVDELRVNNHRKASGVSMLGLEGPAASNVKQRGTLGKMEKNGPEKEFEVGPNRYMTTTGLEKGPTLRPIQEDRYTNRPETTQSYSGIAGGDSKTSYVEGEYMPSTNQELGSIPISAASAVGKGGPNEADFGSKSQHAYNNGRSANKQQGYFGMIGGAIGSVVAPLLDIVRPSRKENTIGTLRPYQNASTTVPQSYVFNPADRPNTTTRETTENAKFHLNAGSSQFDKGGYTVTPTQPIQNARMNQSDFFYSGNSSAAEGSKGLRPYDAEYNQRNNDVKSSTIDGRLVSGNMSLLNNQVNIASGDRSCKMSQNYINGPSNARGSGLDTMGQLQGKQQLYSGLGNDRVNNLDIPNMLNGNPYALSITK